METDQSISKWFGTNLAKLLATKISGVYKDFAAAEYISAISEQINALTYSQRVALHADMLKKFLPMKYDESIKILLKILGDENPNQTGMFTHYYWILPIGKFVEKYGLDDFDTSLKAIEEITKRNTGEYAIRPYLRKYPLETINTMTTWSKSDNFHLRRLAAEGLRPKLPWATKLEIFIDNPAPVFAILANLMTDEVKFVQKSVANTIRDYLKVNKNAAVAFMHKYSDSQNQNTQWILRHAMRKMQPVV